MVTIATVLQEESQYLTGNRPRPQSNSVLESGVSPITMRFNIALLICSSCGVICCLFLLYGLFKDEKIFLLPWIFIVIVCSFIDVLHLIYLFFFASLVITPITAMILTLDFFLLCLNTYSVLCVISQYQEYSAGRGTASDDCRHRPLTTRVPQVPAVQYNVRPTGTATSCLSSRRAVALNGSNNNNNNETRPTTATTATPTQSPIAAPLVQLVVERSPGPRKHVQFPDTASTTGLLNDKTDEALATRLKDQCCATTEMDCLLVPANHHYHQHNHHGPGVPATSRDVADAAEV